jgi:hypothetical protein
MRPWSFLANDRHDSTSFAYASATIPVVREARISAQSATSAAAFAATAKSFAFTAVWHAASRSFFLSLIDCIFLNFSFHSPYAARRIEELKN